MRYGMGRCFDYLGDIGDDVGGNRNRPMPSWYDDGVEAEVPAAAAAPSPSATPPRLIALLNSAAVPSYTASQAYQDAKGKNGADLDFASPGALEVGFLLNHIYARLSTPFISDTGSSGAESPWGTTAQVDDDEHWARRIAEMLTLLPYTTPATGYCGYITPNKLGDGNMMYKVQDDADPGWPLVMECQHTVTTAAITRGFAVPVASTAAGDPPGLLADKLFGAAISDVQAGALTLRAGNHANGQTAGKVQWVNAAAAGSSLSQYPAIFAPGSSLVFNSSPNGRTQSADAHPHTAFAIRVLRDPAQKLQAIQYFDVGGMNVPDSPQISSVQRPYDNISHAFEYPWSTTGQAGAVGTFRGMTVLGVDAPSLTAALAAARKSRPLGMARLVLAKRKKADGSTFSIVKDDPKDWLLYASPFLRMWENGDDKNYAPSRYLWSLRDLPGASEIAAYWLISIPRGDLAESFAFGLGGKAARQAASRTTSLSDIVGDVAQRKNKQAEMAPEKPLQAQAWTLGILDLGVMVDGKVAVVDCCRSSASEPHFVSVIRDDPGTSVGAKALRDLPWGKATGSGSVDLNQLSGIPGYFSGTP